MTKYRETIIPEKPKERPTDPLALKLWELDQKMDKAELEERQKEEERQREEEFKS